MAICLGANLSERPGSFNHYNFTTISRRFPFRARNVMDCPGEEDEDPHPQLPSALPQLPRRNSLRARKPAASTTTTNDAACCQSMKAT
jgi:hypothetical protein